MNLSSLNLEFEISHAKYDQLHDHDGIEIAFVGLQMQANHQQLML